MERKQKELEKQKVLLLQQQQAQAQAALAQAHLHSQLQSQTPSRYISHLPPSDQNLAYSSASFLPSNNLQSISDVSDQLYSFMSLQLNF